MDDEIKKQELRTGYRLNTEFLKNNSEYIHQKLTPLKGINAYYGGFANNSIHISIANIQEFPVEICRLIIDNRIEVIPKNRTIISGIQFPTENPFRYPTSSSDNIIYNDFIFTLPAGITLSESEIKNLVVQFKLLGHSKIRNESVIPWDFISDNFTHSAISLKNSNLEDFGFIHIDSTNNQILFPSGKWRLKNNLILPIGYSLIITKGTQIDLVNKSSIMVRGAPVELIGSREEPIVITSSDRTGEGILILDAKNQQSIISYSLFSNLSVPTFFGTGYSGAITIYQAPVIIDSSIFLNNREGDDMLDLVRSPYKITNCFFSGVRFDGIDDDFGSGIIANTSFKDIGNDAIDLSGANTQVHDCYITNTGDKGISVGEISKVAIENVILNNTSVGIASKDNSYVIVNNVTQNEGLIGFVAYQKKTEYAPSTLIVDNSKMVNVKNPYLVEIGSTVQINGKNMNITHMDIYDEYYAGNATIIR